MPKAKATTAQVPKAGEVQGKLPLDGSVSITVRIPADMAGNLEWMMLDLQARAKGVGLMRLPNMTDLILFSLGVAYEAMQQKKGGK